MSLNPTRPGDLWRDAIILTDANGLPVAPDSTPKAILFVNGSPLTTTVTVTQATDNVSGTLTGVANQALTGVYTLSATLSGRSNADVVRALVQATIATKVYYQWSDDVRLVQWSSTTLPAGAARSSTGLPAVADIQSYSVLGPLGAANADGTTSMIVYDLATPLVGATSGRWLICASTGEISRITLIDQNVGTSNWQYHVSPAFTSFTSPAGLQFAALNLSLPVVDGNGKAAATVAAGDGADAAANKLTLGNAGAGLTNLGDARLMNLDATVSSRSTYAGADTPGTTMLLTRIGSAITIAAGKVAATIAAGDGADAAAIKIVTDELAAMLQPGTGAKQFTQQALAQAPTGSGGGSISADDIDAIAAASAAAIAGTINPTIYAPATGGTLDLFRGDSYAAADGRGIVITRIASETYWPTTLTTVDFYCTPTDATLVDDPAAASLGPIPCTIGTATGSGQSFTLELTGAQMLTLQAGLTRSGGYRFWFIANRTTAPATLRSGSMTVRPDPTATA